MRALYFTRATAPYGEGPLYHHIGLYAYRRAALERFVTLPPSPLEQREKLEQLRALEAGMRIDAAIVSSVPLGVDTPEDLETARRLLSHDVRSSHSASRVKRNGTRMTKKKIAFQGEPGANSHLACREAYPDFEPMPCPTFEDAFAAVSSGDAALGMIPVENSIAGRVADIHHLMPNSGLHIVAEWFLPVKHQLMAPKGATLAGIKTVESHVHALGQCRNIIRKLKIKAIVAADTAGSAREVAERGDKSCAAIASRLAAEIYGLDILAEDVEDEAHNTTRFIVLAREPKWAEGGNGPVVTTFIFRVRNIPAALYKAMGGFATNGVNMTKLESYMVERQFLRHHVLRRHRGPSRRSQRDAGAEGAGIFLQGDEDPRRLSGASVSRDVQGSGGVSGSSAAIAQCVDKQSKRLRVQTTAWVVKVISRKWRAPISQNSYEPSGREMRADLIFRQVCDTNPGQNGV